MEKRSLIVLLVFVLVFSMSIISAPHPGEDLDTCTAYFEGYKFHAEKGECKLQSASGCENPFEYKTKEECERAHSNEYKKPESELDECVLGCKGESDFEDKKDDLKCLDCGDGCFPAKQVAAMYCQPPTSGKPKCGVKNGECAVLGFKDDEFEDELSESEEELYLGYENEELEESAGSKPGSAFYFIDRFFDKFGDEIKVKEERIAEIKAMVEEGDIEGAKAALEDYMELADELEHEIDPERSEEAKRSAAAIRNAMKDIRDKLPPGERGDFVSEIMRKEHSIATAAEISSKIRTLCVQLSELDPNQYYSVCKAGDDAPKWQTKLDKKLTKEQKEEAKKFGKIMKKCFETSGQDCACEEIPYPDFSEACSKAAPLATACDIDGDEEACTVLDNLEMPELPPHLQEIMDLIEGDVVESRYDLHMPPECVRAGASTPKECSRVMIEVGAPEECKQALLDSGCEAEWECRKICDKIMMDLHSPRECKEEGITDPDECARLMENFRHEGPMDRGHVDYNCREIEDSTERLACFDRASSKVDSSYGGGFDDPNYEGPCMTDSDWRKKKEECQNKFGRHAGDEPIYGDSGDGYECVVDAKCVDFGDYSHDYEEIKQRERECAHKCESEGKPWDFTGGNCKCGEPGQYSNNEGGFYSDDSEVKCDDCQSKCEERSGQRLKGTGCGSNGCECYYESIESNYDEPSYDSSTETDSSDVGYESDSEQSSIESTESSTDESNTESSETESSSGEDSTTEGDEDASITGNAFLDYYD